MNFVKLTRVRVANRKRFIIFISIVSILVLSLCIKGFISKDKDLAINAEADAKVKDVDTAKNTNDLALEKEKSPKGNKDKADTVVNELNDNEAQRENGQEKVPNEEAPKEEAPKEVQQKGSIEIKYDYNKEFQNCVFFGDSITESISYYKFVDESRVLGIKGLTSRKAMSKLDKVVEKGPEKIFILFGMNDVIDGEGTFIEGYTKLIDALKERLPNTKIYIQSILPVDDRAKKRSGNLNNPRIDEFNRALKEMAEKEGVSYMDVAAVAKQYGDELREPDGIHYKYKFYIVWLNYIKENM